MRSAPRTSEILCVMVAHIEKRGHLTLGEGLKLLGERAIALGILLLSLVNSLPVPGIPGFSTITGLPIMLLAAHLVLGAESVWLPKKWRNAKIEKGKIAGLLSKLQPKVEKIEKLLKPRWLYLSEPPARNLLGLLMIAVAGVLALPIPFFNFPCGLTLSLLALGLTERDGLVTVLGIVATLSIVAMAVGFGSGVEMLF